jgi:hypothetical protein
MDEANFIIKMLNDAGFSGMNSVILMGMSIVITALWRRLSNIHQDQVNLHDWMVLELERIKSERDECEEARASLTRSNLHLDRFKARCEDVCPNSSEVHKHVLNGSRRQ